MTQLINKRGNNSSANTKVRKPTNKKNLGRFKIEPIKGKTKTTYRVSGYKKSGERVRDRFPTLEKAKAHKQALDVAEIRDQPMTITKLSESQVEDAEAAVKLLGHNGSLVEAVSYFNSNYKRVSDAPLKQTILQFIEHKETSRITGSGLQRSNRTIYDLKNRLKHFSEHMSLMAAKIELGDLMPEEKICDVVGQYEPKAVDQVLEGDIKTFLETKEGSWNNYRKVLFGFFNWCCKNSICASNPVKNIETRGKLRVIEILSVDEVRSLLQAAMTESDGELLAYYAISIFAGIRPESEAHKLDWKHIGLTGQKMRIQVGKVGKARAIEVNDTLIQWLEICDRTKPIIPRGNLQRKKAKVKRMAGFKGGVRDTKKQREIDDQPHMKDWVEDYTRHTYISNYIARHNDIYKAATLCGTSPEVIRQHYDGLIVDLDRVDAFWDITPNSISNSNILRFA